MPSVLTHYGFNKELFDNSIEFLKDNEDIYLVGAQGPDPFFFYGINPFLSAKNSKVIRLFGNKLHKMDPSKMFEFFLDYADKSKDKDILYSYILGAVLHYILDRKIHPYVFYKTGFSDDNKMKKKYFADHTLFETHIDVLLMNDRYKKYKVRTIDSIKCDEDKIEIVSEMYEQFSKNVLKENMVDDDSFTDAYKHMCNIEKVLYSKYGVKKILANLLVKNTPLNTMMHPRTIKDDESVDYLNKKKNKWKDPATCTVYEKSLYELIDEAREESLLWINLLKDSYNSRKINLKNFTKGFIYDGYLEGSKMKEFKSVYKKEENK